MKMLYRMSFFLGETILRAKNSLKTAPAALFNFVWSHIAFTVDIPLSIFRTFLLGFGQGIQSDIVIKSSEQMTRRHVIISYAMTVYGFWLYFAVRRILTGGF